MNVKAFLEVVEIRTKVASMLPFLMGTLYAFYRFEHFDPVSLALMFISLLSFDMATTAINNYYDFKKAAKKSGYGYETHNAIVRYGIKEPVAAGLIALLLLLAAGCGILLVFRTGLLVFLLGGLSFLIGILYSFGPIPISRMPLGELFSGLFMGFVIIFVSAYIHGGAAVASLVLEGGWASLQVNVPEVLYLLWFSMPAVLGIAGIMLANNICDVEDDVENRRYTLPVYIGVPNSLVLFKLLYYAAFADIPGLIILGIHPLLALLPLLVLIPLRRHIAAFSARQTKAETFVLSVRNFVLLALSRIAVLALAIAIQAFTG